MMAAHKRIGARKSCRATAPRLVFVGRSTATGLFLKVEVGELRAIKQASVSSICQGVGKRRVSVIGPSVYRSLRFPQPRHCQGPAKLAPGLSVRTTTEQRTMRPLP